MADINLGIMLYVVTGIYGFLIIFLFAFIIHLYQKVQHLTKDHDDDDSDIRSPPRKEPDFALPKPNPKRPHDQGRNYDPPTQKRERSPPQNFSRGEDDFGGIDFNNRMKPSSSQGGSYKNPLFAELESKYDFVDTRDSKHSKPPAPGFRPQKNDYMYPKREYQNSNYRY